MATLSSEADPRAVIPDLGTIEKLLSDHGGSGHSFDFNLGCGHVYCDCGWSTDTGLNDTWGSTAHAKHFHAVLTALLTQPAAGGAEVRP